VALGRTEKETRNAIAGAGHHARPWRRCRNSVAPELGDANLQLVLSVFCPLPDVQAVRPHEDDAGVACVPDPPPESPRTAAFRRTREVAASSPCGRASAMERPARSRDNAEMIHPRHMKKHPRFGRVFIKPCVHGERTRVILLIVRRVQ
jgi:hypothetical protein